MIWDEFRNVNRNEHEFFANLSFNEFCKGNDLFGHCVKMMASFPPPLEQVVIFFSLSTWNHDFVFIKKSCNHYSTPQLGASSCSLFKATWVEI
jgi:hypothetical protein